MQNFLQIILFQLNQAKKIKGNRNLNEYIYFKIQIFLYIRINNVK